MSYRRTGSSIAIPGVVPIKPSRLEATFRCAVSIPIPLVVQLPTTVVVPIVVISEIPRSGALLPIMLLSWMSMLCETLILSVSQLVTIFAFYQIPTTVFPRVIVRALRAKEDPLLAMTILDHLSITSTSQLRLTISPISKVLVIEASMSLTVMKTVLLMEILFPLFPTRGSPTTSLGRLSLVQL